MTSWTQRDVHGSLYVYVRGVLVMKTWPNGAERLFQPGGFPDDEMRSKPAPKRYKCVDVYVGGVRLIEEPSISF